MRWGVEDMTTSRDLRALLTEVLAKHGFTGDGRIWTRRTPGLRWIVELDRSPYAEKFSIEIGASLPRLVTGAEPVRASFCPLLVHLENLPLADPAEVPDPRLADFRTAVIAGLDLTADMSDEARTALVTSIAETLGTYLQRVSTEDDLRAQYRAGHFRSAALEKGFRRVLDPGLAPPVPSAPSAPSAQPGSRPESGPQS
jgi:hypothetical protein